MKVLNWAARMWNTFRSHDGEAIILMYHRVAVVETDPWGLCVSPGHFAEHLDVLRRFGSCLTVGEAMRRLERGRLPRRAIAVTFDDGYADNLTVAKPLLDGHDVPATFFLAAGLLDKDREFWWDELERILMWPRTLPSELKLPVSGELFLRRIPGGAAISSEERRLHRGWRYWESPPTPRHALYLELWKLLKPLPHEHRRDLLAELRSWASAPPDPRPSHRPLSPDEAAALGAGGLVEIGGHTLTHPTLPALAVVRQREEIALGKQRCEALWGRRVTSFSYPFGDYSGETRELVRKAGFSSACGTQKGRTTRRSNRLRLPRLPIGDVTGEHLERQLCSV